MANQINPYSFPVNMNANLDVHGPQEVTNLKAVSHLALHIADAINVVFSNQFVNFLGNDLKTPSVTFMGKMFDKFLGLFFDNVAVEDTSLVVSKWGKNHLKKRMPEDEEFGPPYREGLYFTNWPPFTFNDINATRKQCDYNAVGFMYDNGTIAPNFLFISLSLGQTCYIFERQKSCFDAHFGYIFSSEFHPSIEEIFGGNTSNVSYRSHAYKQSEILPMKWDFLFYTNQHKLSDSFIEAVEKNLTQLAACEREAYVRQTATFGACVGALSFVVAGCAGFTAFVVLNRRDPEEFERDKLINGPQMGNEAV